MAAALILGLIGIGVADGKAQCIAAGLAPGTGSGLLGMFVAVNPPRAPRRVH